MSDSYRCFVTIMSSLKSLYQCEPKGNFYRRLRSAAFLINGIILSKSCRLPDVSGKCADLRKPISREKSFYRLLRNDRFSYEVYYMSFAQALIQAVQTNIIAVTFDGSIIGHGCITLVAGLVYKNRSLPLCWIVKKGGKGHFKEEIHMELLDQLIQLVPKGKTIVILGDGEFDGSDFLVKVKKNNWLFVTRTAENRLMTEENESFQMRDMDVGDQEYFWIPKVSPENSPALVCNAVIWWSRDFKEPIYLFTNMDLIREALFWYKKRFTVETFFSDQKSRGFNIHKSHISDPERLEKLLIAAALAYIFIVYLGIVAVNNNMLQTIHRKKRCDWSIFKIGSRFLNYQLSQFADIPKMTQLNLFSLIQ